MWQYIMIGGKQKHLLVFFDNIQYFFPRGVCCFLGDPKRRHWQAFKRNINVFLLPISLSRVTDHKGALKNILYILCLPLSVYYRNIKNKSLTDKRGDLKEMHVLAAKQLSKVKC